jgi:hypothetical protein
MVRHYKRILFDFGVVTIDASIARWMCISSLTKKIFGFASQPGKDLDTKE